MDHTYAAKQVPLLCSYSAKIYVLYLYLAHTSIELLFFLLSICLYLYSVGFTVGTATTCSRRVEVGKGKLVKVLLH